MIDTSVTFQRTQAGRDEIHQKSHGLTQSERLVLIMIDGVTPYDGVRAKLPVLTDERFARAYTRLLQKDLVCEVFLPVEGQAAEEIDRSIIDRFLQQDPLDPLTIMLIDPDDQFDEFLKGPSDPPVAVSETSTASVAQQADVQATASNDTPEHSMSPRNETVEPAMDEAHIQLADLLAEEVRARQAARPARIEPSQPRKSPAPSPGVTESFSVNRGERFRFTHIHWGYWLMGVGFAFIAGFYLAKLLA